MIDCVSAFYGENDIELSWPIGLNYRDRSNRLSIVTKTKLENYVIDYVDVVYIENEIDLPWLIGLSTMFVEN